MCELSPTPLALLSQECADCLHKEGEHERAQAGCEPCRELAFRALCDGNDAAWDLLAHHLWPFILRWLYGALPELTPARIEMLGYQALWRFRRTCEQHSDLAANFPTFPGLLTLLRRSLRQVIASRTDQG